jgi:hypothetical protein
VLSFSQQQIQVNYGVDTNNIDNKAILSRWRKYISYNTDFTDRDKQHSTEFFWSKNDIRQYKYPDLLNNCGALSPSLLGLGLSNKVIAISARNDFYTIKSIFYYKEHDSVFVPIAIANYPLKKENGNFYFYNALHINTHLWKEKRVGKILYHYNSTHQFNYKNAGKANDAYLTLTSLFDIKQETLNYYIFDSCDNLYETIGFDYRIGMGGENNRCGYFDAKNNIVYTGGYENPEFHEHELIHIINNSFTNAHEWFLAGISGYWGGHFGKSLQYHINRVYAHLIKNPDINLNNLLQHEKLDDFTNPTYVYGGILCHLALKKKGIDGLKRLLNYGKEEADFYKAIETELGIPQNKLHEEMMKLLKEYSAENFQVIPYQNLLRNK